MVSNGKKSFQNMNVNDMVHLFNRTIKNMLHNFIPHEVITCDDRDPPWINSSIKRLIQAKNEAYKRFKRSHNNSQYFENFQSIQNLLGVSIEASKEKYYSRLSKKLMEPSTSPKTYWSVLKSFHNNKKYPAFHQFFTKIVLLQISKKKPNCLILFLLSNVQSLITVVKFPLSCIPKLINLYQISRLLKKI